MKLQALEFVPFANDIGFLCASFVCADKKSPIPFRTAIDLNYYLPYVQFNQFPLVSEKKGKNHERQFYIGGLFHKACESLRDGQVKTGDCWDIDCDLKPPLFQKNPVFCWC